MALPDVSALHITKKGTLLIATASVLVLGAVYGLTANKQAASEAGKRAVSVQSSAELSPAEAAAGQRAAGSKLSPAAGMSGSSSAAAAAQGSAGASGSASTATAAPPAVPAAGMTIGLSAGTVTPGGSFSVRIYENSGGQPVNAVQAKLDYDASVVEVVSVDAAGPFPIAAATNTSKAGTISLARGSTEGIIGLQPFTGITFRVKPGVSGSVELKLDKTDSYLVRAADASDILQTVSGASLAIRN